MIFTATEIRQSGATSVGDFLEHIPSVAGRGVSEATNVNGRGTSSVNFRGLDAARTLVLLNGRRHIATNNLGNALAVDLNSIPMALIERIEVVNGGASSVYGSDAVAGVINIILRDHINGTEGELQSSVATEGDGLSTLANVSWGRALGAGNVIVSASYLDRESVYAGDRDLFRTLLVETGNPPVPVAGGSGNTGAPRQDSLIIPAPGAAARPFTLDDAFNTAPLAYLQTPQHRLALNVLGHYPIANGGRAFTELGYTDRRSSQLLGAFPMAVGPNQLGGRLRQLIRDNSYNTFPNAKTFGTFQRRFVEAGSRGFDQTNGVVRAVVGVEGGRQWHWETSYVFGRSRVAETITARPHLGRLADALDPAKCSAATNPSAGVAPCVNLFYPGSLRQVDLDWIIYTDLSHFTAREHVLSGFVTHQFAAGKGVQIAAGSELRREEATDDPDPVTAAGLSGGSQRDPTNGGYTVAEVFGETRVPLLRDRAFARALTVEAGGRFSHLSVGGSSSAFTYRGGVDWRVRDGIALRGAYATALRAPNVNELYLGKGRTFPAVADICGNLTGSSDATLRANCTAQGVPLGMNPAFSFETPAAIGGNRELKPETARTWSAGVDLQPFPRHGFTTSLSWFDISLRDPIAATSVATIYDECYRRSNSDFCRFVTRDPLNGQLVEVFTPYVNQSFIRTSGMDVLISEYEPLSDGRALSINAAATWLSTFDEQALAGSAIRSRVGYIEPAGGAYPRWRGRVGTQYTGRIANRAIKAAWTWRYIGALRSWRLRDAPGALNSQPTISPYSYHDLSLEYELPRATVIIGLLNALDKKAPYYTGAPDTNTDAETFDTVGRRAFVGLRFKL